MSYENNDTVSVEEEKIVESYNSFIGLIDTSDIKKKKLHNKWLFIISIVMFIYGALGGIGDIGLIIEFYDTFIGRISSLISLVLSFVIFNIAYKRKRILENDCERDYKPILESNLNLELDDNISSDEDFEKLSKSEYINAGFKYADDHYDYLYWSTEKIVIDKNIEAYLVRIDKSTDPDNIVYIIDGYITKQKIKSDKNHMIKDIGRIVSEFNKQYGYSIKDNIEVSLYNGYLYVLINEINLYFEYSKLTEYEAYKRLYYNLKLIRELSEFIYNNINDFS